jgi:RNA polymerase sigma-70 factor (sigma-E family)
MRSPAETVIVPGKLLASGAVPAPIYERHGPARDAVAWPRERTIMRCMKTRPGREPPSSPAELDAGHAVATLYELHYPALVRLAALLVPDLATAEDIVQDAFAAVHGRWHTLPGADADAALAYLRWSVVHRSRSVVHRSRSVVHRSRSVPPPGPAEGAREPGSEVVSALRALSARQREVVVLRYFADLPEAEIASATGMSMAAVRKHAAQAMSSLQAGLGG